MERSTERGTPPLQAGSCVVMDAAKPYRYQTFKRSHRNVGNDIDDTIQQIVAGAKRARVGHNRTTNNRVRVGMD